MSKLDPPLYSEFYPNMSSVSWASGSSRSSYHYWMSGLSSIAMNSLRTIFGDFDAFELNPSDPLNFSTFDSHHFLTDSIWPIVYLSICVLIALTLLVACGCWCLCNKCCCIFCVVAEDDDGDKDKSRKLLTKRLVFVIIMGVWLVLFIFSLRFTLAANKATNDVIFDLHKDVNNSIADIASYVHVTRLQVKYTFKTCFWAFRDKVKKALEHCTGTGCNIVGDILQNFVSMGLDKAAGYIIKHTTEIDVALLQVFKKIKDAEKELQNRHEKTFVELEKILHTIFIFVNILYCIAIVFVIVGTICVTFGQSKCVRSFGLVTLRICIIYLFVLGVSGVIQVVTLFLLAGPTSQVICPALRKFENAPFNVTEEPENFKLGDDTNDLLKVNDYKVPQYSAIISACKADLSAYKAFQLKQAYDINNILILADSYFNYDLAGLLQFDKLFKHLKHLWDNIGPFLSRLNSKEAQKALKNLQRAAQSVGVNTDLSKFAQLPETALDMEQISQLTGGVSKLNDLPAAVQNNIQQTGILNSATSNAKKLMGVPSSVQDMAQASLLGGSGDTPNMKNSVPNMKTAAVLAGTGGIPMEIPGGNPGNAMGAALSGAGPIDNPPINDASNFASGAIHNGGSQASGLLAKSIPLRFLRASSDKLSLSLVEVFDEIKAQAVNYTHFIVSSIKNDLGRCKPAYIAVNETLNAFCIKAVAPIASFWWILQFIVLIIGLIILTAMCIDRLVVKIARKDRRSQYIYSKNSYPKMKSKTSISSNASSTDSNSNTKAQK